MKEIEVFLLDLHPSCGFAEQLSRLLEAIPALRPRVCQAPESGGLISDEGWRATLADLNPSAIFLLWPPDRTGDA